MDARYHPEKWLQTEGQCSVAICATFRQQTIQKDITKLR